MECDDRALLDQWISAWRDLVDFDVHPVVTSADAAARLKEGVAVGIIPPAS
jgi:hypothetical protein